MTHIPELERQLLSAARRREHTRRLLALHGRSRTVLAVSIITFGLTGAAIAAVTDVLRREPPTPQAVAAYEPQGPVEYRSATTAARGGERWMLRVWGRRDDDLCVQPGQLSGTRFGLRFAGGPERNRFVPLLYTDGPTCGVGAVRAIHLLDQASPGPDSRVASTLVYGVVPDELLSGEVRLWLDSVRQPVSAESGTFLAVLPGATRLRSVRVSVSTESGDHELADFGRGERPTTESALTNLTSVSKNQPLFAQRTFRNAGGSRCALAGQSVDGLVGRLGSGLPGAFEEAPTSDASCIDNDDPNRLVVVDVRTQPSDPNTSGAGPTAGFLVVQGIATADITDIEVVTPDGVPHAASRDNQSGWWMAVAPVDLSDPFATDLGERLAGKAMVRVHRADGSVGSQPLR